MKKKEREKNARFHSRTQDKSISHSLSLVRSFALVITCVGHSKAHFSLNSERARFCSHNSPLELLRTSSCATHTHAHAQYFQNAIDRRRRARWPSLTFARSLAMSARAHEINVCVCVWTQHTQHMKALRCLLMKMSLTHGFCRFVVVAALGHCDATVFYSFLSRASSSRPVRAQNLTVACTLFQILRLRCGSLKRTRTRTQNSATGFLGFACVCASESRSVRT